MAQRGPKVPAQMRRELIAESGGGCANPECANVAVQLHHIEEWHVYQTHTATQMIAVCPACHDAVHCGDLRINDEELYRWKELSRSGPAPAHLFIQPSAEAPLLLLGSIATRGESGLVVFDFANRHRLSFTVVGDEIMHVSATIYGPDGTLLVEVIDGYVLKRQPDVEVNQRPGRIRLEVSGDRAVLSEWAELEMSRSDFRDEEVVLLDLHVIEPGVVKVQGVWLDAAAAWSSRNPLCHFSTVAVRDRFRWWVQESRRYYSTRDP